MYKNERVNTRWCPKTCGKCPDGGNWQINMLKLVNEARAAKKMRLLCINKKLTAAAETHAANMVKFNFFSHTGRDNSKPNDRARAAGYQSICTHSENIAKGPTTVEAAMKQFTATPADYLNIIDAYCNAHAGFARVGNTWVQIFGSDPSEGWCGVPG